MSELKGWHVLLMLSAFFGVMIAVNVVFMVYAYETFTGEDTSSPYLKGLQFNHTLAERATQARLEWRATIDFEPSGNAFIATTTIRDKHGNPELGLRVTMTMRRPTNAALDRELTLDPVRNGRYVTNPEVFAPGQWDASVRSVTPDGRTFEATRRVVLP